MRDAQHDHADPSKGDRANRFGASIREKEDRRLRERQRGERGVWFWLGMFGMVGWSVSIPTLVGLAIGLWADRAWPSGVSFALTGLVLGAILGGATAWYWVRKESNRE